MFIKASSVTAACRKFAYRRSFVRQTNRRVRKSPPPYNATVLKGSVHIAATRKFVEYATKDFRAKLLLQWLKNTGSNLMKTSFES